MLGLVRFSSSFLRGTSFCYPASLKLRNEGTAVSGASAEKKPAAGATASSTSAAGGAAGQSKPESKPPPEASTKEEKKKEAREEKERETKKKKKENTTKHKKEKLQIIVDAVNKLRTSVPKGKPNWTNAELVENQEKARRFSILFRQRDVEESRAYRLRERYQQHALDNLPEELVDEATTVTLEDIVTYRYYSFSQKPLQEFADPELTPEQLKRLRRLRLLEGEELEDDE